MLSKIKDKLENLWWYIEDGFWSVHDWFTDRTGIQKIIITVIIVLIALALVVFVFGVATNDEEENQEEEVQTTEEIVDVPAISVDEVSEETIDFAGALGYDAARANADIDYIKQMLSRAFTFSDSESYNFARGELLDKYGVSRDSQFMRQVMPETSSNSTTSLSVLSTDGYVTSVDGNNYEYTLETVLRVTTSTGNVADNRVVVVCTTGGEKSISDLRAYMADFSVLGEDTGENN